MTATPIKLGSVHLTENGLRELDSCLRSLSDEPEIEIQVKSNGFTVSESSATDIISSDLVTNEALAYEVYLTCDRGTLRIVGNSKEDEHLLYLSGEIDWKETAEHRLTQLMKARETEWRSFLDERMIAGIEVFAAIGLSNSLNILLPGEILFPEISLLDYTVFAVSIFALFSAVQRNRVYPYVAVSFDGTVRYPKFSAYLIPFSFSVGLIAATLL